MAQDSKKPGEPNGSLVDEQKETLDIRDLITDESDPLAEYLSVSVSNDGHDTTISTTSPGSNPQVTETVITGLTANDLQDLIQGVVPDTPTDTDVS